MEKMDNIDNIGTNIAKLRKEKGITQEALGQVLGVTAQAISKWESGGSPDTSLLPSIADYFNISIDTLFGRNPRFSKLTSALQSHLLDLPEEKRITAMLDILVNTLYTYITPPDDLNLDFSVIPFEKVMEDALKMGAMGSEVITANGLLKAHVNTPLSYFLLMPEPEAGWGDKLHFKEEYTTLFKLLSCSDTLRTIFFLAGRTGKYFTPKLLEKELKIPQTTATNILHNLAKYDLITSETVDIDDETTTIYRFDLNLSFIPFFTFAEDLIKRNRVMFFHYLDRDEVPTITKKGTQKS